MNWSLEAFVVHIRGDTLVCVPGRMERSEKALATTSIVLMALLDGRIEWDEAVRSKLVVIEGIGLGQCSPSQWFRGKDLSNARR